jgi:hypothetical protein
MYILKAIFYMLRGAVDLDNIIGTSTSEESDVLPSHWQPNLTPPATTSLHNVFVSQHLQEPTASESISSQLKDLPILPARLLLTWCDAFHPLAPSWSLIKYE